eukprot:CAMPEP_0201559868 /NCGR_PEP_ID=MMETSP0173_2-20130828/76903_1 /ASSEMBLY_ACC=CAM_ASM_000268 /TAXON_ID=218659 /ORGANISM="Vexillifera sp., Strain DIVA3 564/2" /LENGTH=332 /DNA_ID=CAMNT_0047974199 /DNA_START=158 /DNA_END=1153 /DNA_ORIENTATION=-
MSLSRRLGGSRVNLSWPVLFAPWSIQYLMNKDEGERGTFRAARTSSTAACLSTVSSLSIEEAAKESGDNIRFYQLYVWNDLELTLSLVRRAEKAGFSALVVTADLPPVGKRVRNIRNNFTIPPHVEYANFKGRKETEAFQDKSGNLIWHEFVANILNQSLQWKDIAWLIDQTSLPVYVKGILHPNDALKALQIGCAGIIVSTHGARQHDSFPSSLEQLPSIVSAVRGARASSSISVEQQAITTQPQHLPLSSAHFDILIDGGIQSGDDVFKALAMGADAVMIGRPVAFALAAAGQKGVEHLVSLIKNELILTMQLCGITSIDEISLQFIQKN